MKANDLGHIVTYKLNSKGIKVSPKKLQKLLYYIEAWNLVHLDTPLIDENFQAWVHGPVLPSLYQTLRDFGFNNIEVVNDELETVDEEIEKIISDNNVTEDQLELIDSVLNKYGYLNSFELEMLTHNEQPWKEARGNKQPHERCNNIISKTLMKEFYSNVI